MKKLVVISLLILSALSLHAQEEMTREEWETQQSIKTGKDSATIAQWAELCKIDKDHDAALRNLGIEPGNSLRRYRIADSLAMFGHTSIYNRIIKRDLRKRERADPEAHERHLQRQKAIRRILEEF